jgi:hypothetical protein
VHTQAAEDVSQEKTRGEIEAEEDPISPISGKFTAGRQKSVLLMMIATTYFLSYTDEALLLNVPSLYEGWYSEGNWSNYAEGLFESVARHASGVLLRMRFYRSV